jgi:hypothetical protein
LFPPEAVSVARTAAAAPVADRQQPAQHAAEVGEVGHAAVHDIDALIELEQAVQRDSHFASSG